MSYTSISVREARNKFSEIIEKAALAGESFLVTKFGKPKVLIIAADAVGQEKNVKLESLAETAGLWAKRKAIEDSAAWTAKRRKKESSRYEKVFS